MNFRLYVVHGGRNSARARRSVRRWVETTLPSPAAVEIVDLALLAEIDRPPGFILAPSLLRLDPPPRVFIPGLPRPSALRRLCRGEQARAGSRADRGSPGLSGRTPATFEQPWLSGEIDAIVVEGRLLRLDPSGKGRPKAASHPSSSPLRESEEEAWRILRALAGRHALAEERLRAQVARALHDEVAQLLVYVMMKLDVLRLGSAGEPHAVELEELAKHLGEVVQRLRGVMADLSPPLPQEMGFREGLRWLVERWSERHGIACSIKDGGDPGPPPEELRAVVLAAVRELLEELARRGGLTSARLRLERRGEQLNVVLEPVGAGIQGASMSGELRRVRDRLHPFGGDLELRPAGKRGLRIRMTLPWENATGPGNET